MFCDHCRPFHITLLVMAKADIAARDLKLQRGVLHLAAANGHSDAIPTFVQLGASIMAKDRAGMTPLDIALECEDVQVTTALKNAEMDEMSWKVKDPSSLDPAAALIQTVLSLGEDSEPARMLDP
jgi:hypothetical protein